MLQEDEDAHLLEYADGETLSSLVQGGKDEEATAIIGDTLNALHKARCNTMPEGLTPLRRWFRSLFLMAEQHGGVYKRAALVAEQLLSNPQDEVILHGDIHHENIRQSARGWLAFDPKGLLGERAYDAANIFCNPMNMEALTVDKSRVMKTADILSRGMHIDKSRLLSFVFAYCALSASWSMEDGQSPDHALQIAHLVENRS